MNKKTDKPLAGNELIKTVIAALKEMKAENIVTINLKKLPGATDWFVICDSDNDAHIRACANHVLEKVKEKKTRPWQYEGLEEGRWVLLDYSDVVIHIMLRDLRTYYNLEELWAEGTIKAIESTATLVEEE